MLESKDNDINFVVRQGLNRSVRSLLIKLSTAGLTYLMFVMFARAMHETEYGLFAVCFSLATILAIAANLGQQKAILRYSPEDEGRGDDAGAPRSYAMAKLATMVFNRFKQWGLIRFWNLHT